VANASKTSMGAGLQGKGDGTGAMTDLPDGVLGENMVLKNRDKSQHSAERGMDGKQIQTEQFHDHVASHESGEVEDGIATGNSSGLAGPMSNSSGALSSLDSQRKKGA
jgi:hypothetical protein